MTDAPTEQQVPAGKPIFSQPATIKLHHACAKCAHVEEIELRFGGMLAVGQAQEPRRVITPGDIARMRG